MAEERRVPGRHRARPVVKRTARAILLDGDELILIKRTKPGREPYWITPGGGVEEGDKSVIAALHREVAEELGARITDVVPAFVDTVAYSPVDDGPPPGGEPLPEGAVKVQHFFVCRLAAMDPSRRHGPEVDEPRGEYAIVRLPFSEEGVNSVEVVPPRLRAYLSANIEGVRALLAPDFD
ncbi:NUDIX domain-containing protein [Streptomyces alkaliterrae]|uniref:NUDIX domain-containing protein n=1 Tax=Streptomyces alkaliterrae TaxID=2213162 RepID=A0A5P0YXJ5_9ACTN|nr:NUDIX hydrolase [Streptomyces alkaliterrae]MBB1252455.1 NUDIX hydrolase [Streptomyces alkaliterrae]MBB1261771.1 NUDIX hydrolase [Streptomyces alkaliterrae]MQS05008.1 NUDIX domain-containing protein [Streptomyces alkaliterrae]